MYRWVFIILAFRFHAVEWSLGFDGIEEQQRDCGKDRNRGLPAMALIVDEFTSFLRRFVIRLYCVYGMEFMSCDSSFDLLCLSLFSFFFFLVLLSFWFIQQSYSYWHSFLTTVTFKSVRTTDIILISIGCLIKRTDTRAMKYIIRRKWNY